MNDAQTKNTAMQWALLLFVMGMGAALTWAGINSKEGFGAYSTAIMVDLALAGAILRSIFKNTEETPNDHD